MEEINKLLNIDDLKIVQNTDWFKFSLDSILLVDFLNIDNKNAKILDLCCGNAPIPLLLTIKVNSVITGVELQKEIFDLAKKSISINNLDDRIELLNIDAKDIVSKYESDTFDIITCNPPYFKVDENSLFNKNDIKTTARHETNIKLEDIFKISKKILKNNGKIALVHRTERFMDIVDEMRKNNIEPKRVRFVYPKTSKNSNLVLVEGSKNGKPGLKILPPLFVHDEDGNYLEKIKELFE